MRFTIGIITGAVLILLLADAAGTADRDWWRRVPALLDELAVAAGDALALPSGQAPVTGERPAGANPPGDIPAPDEVTTGGSMARAAQPAGAEPAARQPIVRPPDPLDAALTPAAAAGARDSALARVEAAGGAAPPAQSEDAVPPAQSEDVAPLAQHEEAGRLAQRADAPQPAQPEAGRGIGAEAFARTDASTAADPAAGRQTVWVPFHSEMSASGFAGRLSESLDHPFQVERQGPGRYQVVFAYQDEPQRRALLDEAAALTGLPL